MVLICKQQINESESESYKIYSDICLIFFCGDDFFIIRYIRSQNLRQNF